MPRRVPEPPPDKALGRVPCVTPRASAMQSPLRHRRPPPPAGTGTPMGLLSPHSFSHAGKENGVTLCSVLLRQKLRKPTRTWGRLLSPTPLGGSIPPGPPSAGGPETSGGKGN